ncbi:hypothetical protein QLQ15_02485 [Lysobacter sp. LF1]|uniref:Uncharacterized protein n=1 Tax=Lysobacter stagni TaxID=3045172 RepID=A0ABT6XCA9_9GAMM|nr:hypothetical protein [Lysobacter sp. LF1]MDI9237777.1 hypothetical protein [Lysobacter sp. LF1]
MQHARTKTSNFKPLRTIAAIALLLLAGMLPATAKDAETAEAFVARSGKAVQEKGPGVVADFMHPDELARFKSMMAPILAMPEGPQADLMARAMFGPQATADSIAKLAPADFMRALLEGTMMKPGMTLKVGETQVLGSVKEGDTVHVVTRSSATVNEVTLTSMEVVSVRPNGDGWGMLLTGNLEGMGQMMRAAAAKQGTPAPAPRSVETPPKH